MRTWLTLLASEILQTSVDPRESLVAQGLDSVTATAFLEFIRSHGYEAEYVDLLNEASIHSLASSLRPKEADVPTPSAGEISTDPFPLTGPQCVWAELEKQGWGSWANISVCVEGEGTRSWRCIEAGLEVPEAQHRILSAVTGRVG